MPLAHYGVAIGTFHDFSRDPTHDFGHWYHGHLSLDTPEGVYQAALDVDAPASVGVSYRLVDDLRVADIATVRALANGFHPLASVLSSGALDYVRSPLLRNRLWFEWLSSLTGTVYRTVSKPPPGSPSYGPDLADSLAERLLQLRRKIEGDRWFGGLHPHLRFFPWVSSNGDNALDVLVPYLQASTRIYVFGQRFTTGLGVHDVHLNQGDPLGSQWYATDGIWQDGAVMCERADGRVVVWQIKFNTQSLTTDDSGHPR
ncbi:DUF2278 family protein [Kitasatospora atroaurantiaca]|uniref:Uncharacterized protein DUF2278 n=1 Tax=Kitasatospora atroaurantiaca TaxID=285545 RepID=A0A561EYB7_9ACTN|nr:DUF2278 family protein [Kitasatospora atroaurantiaca]TWE20608.1 uncharacterized protein DUF2278 [Kitasatospora atroaurantiaca]